MKKPFVVLLLLAAGLAFGQALKLSKPFSKAAIVALRAINATGWALPSSVHELEARQINAQDRMQDAKQAAESQDDADAFVYLQRYQFRHSQNFADYTNAITRTAHRLKGENTLQRAATIVDKEPKFKVRKKKEMACSAALEKELQSRRFSPPAVCDVY